MKCLLVLLAVLGVTVASSDFTQITYKDCRSKFHVKNVELTECQTIATETPGVQGCLFTPGTSPKLRITFESNESDVSDLKTFVMAKFDDGALMDYNLPEDDTCKYGNLACPLKEGTTYSYEQSIKIDPSYPADKFFALNWKIGKSKKSPEVCVVINGKIAKA